MSSLMDDRLPPEDIGTLIKSRAEQLERGEGDPEDHIRHILETLGRSGEVRARSKEIDQNGRAYLGTDLVGVPGLVLFMSDDDGAGEDADGADGEE